MDFIWYRYNLISLYKISTCFHGCKGGSHLFVSFAGRAFNLGYAAYELTLQGLYDEAMVAVRSLGELANLVSYFWSNQDEIEKWANASRKERINRYGPGKIRQKIQKVGGVISMDDSTYQSLCELFTHPTPQISPNNHSPDDKPRVGGFVQPNGIKKCLDELDNTLFILSTGLCKFLMRKSLLG